MYTTRVHKCVHNVSYNINDDKYNINYNINIC